MRLAPLHLFVSSVRSASAQLSLATRYASCLRPLSSLFRSSITNDAPTDSTPQHGETPPVTARPEKRGTALLLRLDATDRGRPLPATAVVVAAAEMSAQRKPWSELGRKTLIKAAGASRRRIKGTTCTSAVSLEALTRPC